MRTRKAFAAFLATALAAASLGMGAQPARAEGEAPAYKTQEEGYHKVWSDEFDGPTLDRDNWNVELHQPGWVNAEWQEYVDSEDNIQVDDGVLKLIPIQTVEDVPLGEQQLLTNADFSEDMAGWEETIANWDNPPLAEVNRTISGNAITYDITNPGTESWNVQLKQANLSLQAGVTYHVSFNATSSVDRTIVAGVQNGDVYTWYGGSDVQLEAQTPQAVSFDFTMSATDSKGVFYVSMGRTDNDTPMESQITLSDFSITYEGSGSGKTSYTSGRINTQNKNTFTYGYFECRAKVPKGKGYLPAFWLMANDENVYGQWPRCGEIDCMEVMGQETNKVYGTIHFGNPHSESQNTKTVDAPDFSDEFHTFGCEWLPGKIIWYVDGVKFHEESRWYSTTEGQGTLSYPAPFDQPFYVILNLAIGGSWVGNPDENTTYGADNAYQVDYVRVYQLDEYDENVTMPEQPFTPGEPDEFGNYVINGQFAVEEDLNDDEDWMFRTTNEGKAQGTIANNMATITTTNAGSNDYSIQLMQAGLHFQKGAKYQVSFEARADESRSMNVDIKAPDHGYKQYMNTFKPSLTAGWQIFTTDEFKMTSDSDENGRLEFNLGAGSTATVQIRNVSVKQTADPNPNEKEEKTVLSNGNYIYNGNFQEGPAHLGYWDSEDFTNVSVTNLKDGRRLKVDGSAKITQDELAFTSGTALVLSFDAQAENAGATVNVTVGGQVYTATLDTEYKTYTFKIPADTVFTNSNIAVEFNGTGTIWLDNIMLCEDSLIRNGSFNNGLTGYEPYVADDANASYVVDSLQEDNALSVTINNTADADWKVQIKQSNISLEKGETYRLSFRAKSTLERPIRVVMQGLEARDWAVYSATKETGDGIVNLTSDFQTFTTEFVMTEESDPAAFLSMCLGKVGEFQTTEQHTVVLDDFVLEHVVEAPVQPQVVITSSDVTVNVKGKLYYNAKERKPSVTVKVNGTTLTKGVDYTVDYSNNRDAGTAKVTVKGKGSYSGTVTKSFKIYKANNTLTAKAKKTISLKASKLAKKGAAVTKKNAFTIKNAKGSVTFAKDKNYNYKKTVAYKKNAKKIVVNKAGKVTIKKGIQKGTYKIKIKVKAAGTSNYKNITKTVYLKVVVK